MAVDYDTADGTTEKFSNTDSFLNTAKSYSNSGTINGDSVNCEKITQLLSEFGTAFSSFKESLNKELANAEAIEKIVKNGVCDYK